MNADKLVVALPTDDKTGNWTEDFPHENGNYQKRCLACTRLFLGHKRRVVCKACARRVATDAKEETT